MINIQSTWLEYVEISQMQSWYCPSSLPDQGSLNAKVTKLPPDGWGSLAKQILEHLWIL